MDRDIKGFKNKVEHSLLQGDMLASISGKKPHAHDDTGQATIKRLGPIVLEHDIKRDLQKETDLNEVFVFDENESLEGRICFVMLAEQRIYFADFNMDEKERGVPDCKLQLVKPPSLVQDVRSVCRIDRKNYIFDFRYGQNVYFLHISESGHVFDVAFNVSEGRKLVAAQADKKFVYVLMIDRFRQYTLRMLKIVHRRNSKPVF